jgi:hypothetical protein
MWHMAVFVVLHKFNTCVTLVVCLTVYNVN